MFIFIDYVCYPRSGREKRCQRLTVISLPQVGYDTFFFPQSGTMSIDADESWCTSHYHQRDDVRDSSDSTRRAHPRVSCNWILYPELLVERFVQATLAYSTWYWNVLTVQPFTRCTSFTVQAYDAVSVVLDHTVKLTLNLSDNRHS